MKYYHFVSAEDERAIKTLGERNFFSSYTKRTEAVAGGEVEVLPLELIAETSTGGTDYPRLSSATEVRKGRRTSSACERDLDLGKVWTQ